MKRLFFAPCYFYASSIFALSYDSGNIAPAAYTVSGVAVGTAYSYTASLATLTFGTTNPTLTIAQGGTYLLTARVRSKYTGATYAANQTLNLMVRRTNNTAAVIVSSTITLRIVTTITDDLEDTLLPLNIYTTTNNNDALAIQGVLSATPSAGSVDATEAEIFAIKLY